MISSILRLLGLGGDAPSGPESYFSRADVWSQVSSSNVHSIAHYSPVAKGDSQPILGVRFLDAAKGAGAEYWYYGVPVGVWLAMLAAGSKGRYVWYSLRDRYRYRRVK